jgi:hypothetical protein
MRFRCVLGSGSARALVLVWVFASSDSFSIHGTPVLLLPISIALLHLALGTVHKQQYYGCYMWSVLVFYICAQVVAEEL